MKKSIPLVIALFFFLLTACATGCGVIMSDRFSQSLGPAPEHGSILRGSGWRGKYGYELPDVNQIETDELIIAVKINNWTNSCWGIGPILPIIPTFGLLKGDEEAAQSTREASAIVTVAVFGKTEKDTFIYPCDVTVARGTDILAPTYVETRFKDTKRNIECRSNADVIRVAGLENDLYYIDVYYEDIIIPEEGLSVIVPTTDADGNTQQAYRFQFRIGNDWFWMIVLL